VPQEHRADSVVQASLALYCSEHQEKLIDPLGTGQAV